jgi:hypothetical protein
MPSFFNLKHYENVIYHFIYLYCYSIFDRNDKVHKIKITKNLKDYFESDSETNSLFFI